MEDFKNFGKIQNIDKLDMSITQKLHGSNAQVYIYRDDNDELKIKAGSRNRWVTPEKDNFGFAKFVYDNKEEFISKLGEGRHFGEWCGPGINSGEGLKEKQLFLFNWRRWSSVELPPKVFCVPVLYTGKFSWNEIDLAMENLKLFGSKLVQDFKKPEGIVVEIGGQLYKKTFDVETVAWKQVEKKEPKASYTIAVDHLLQPLRLEKLLSRDSQYLEQYPESLKTICSDYVKDLEEEGQITGNEDEVVQTKKALGRSIFSFIKQEVHKYDSERNRFN